MTELAVGSCLYICNVCDHNCPDPQLMTHHMRLNHSFLNESDALAAVSAYVVQQEVSEDNASLSTSFKENTDKKLWPREATLALIRLVQEHDSHFQKSVKKHVWTKISTLLNIKFNTDVTWQQCDTKWKSIKKTYKDIKDHNSTSGKNRRKWEFFEEMDTILFNKPEIYAPATCSSHAGLVVNQKRENMSPISSSPNKENVNITEPIPSKSSNESFESSFSRKRKVAANAAERRHKEKLQRQDRFLACFEDFVNTYKNKSKN